MVDFSSIPEEAIEKLADCKTTDDVIELAQQYDIEITPEEAEAALAAGGKDLESLAKHQCGDFCENCKAYIPAKGDELSYCKTHKNKGYGPKNWCSLHDRI